MDQKNSTRIIRYEIHKGNKKIWINSRKVADNSLIDMVFKFEESQMTQKYKFGVLYAGKGQKKEGEFYGNSNKCLFPLTR